MEIVFWLLVFGTLVVVTRPIVSELRISIEQRRQYAVKRRLQAFEYSERVRQTAAAKRSSYEINRLAHEASQAMLRAALEANAKAADRRARERRCQ